MAFCLGLSLLASVLVGLLPALRIIGSAFSEGHALHAGETRTTADRQGERLRTLLVAAQIAMTLVLLIGAGLLIHSFVRLTSVSTGFESSGRDGVLQIVKVTLPERLYDEPGRIHAFSRDVLDRVQSLPGVTSASLINSVPFGMMFIRGDFEIEGQPKPTLDVGVRRSTRTISRPWGFRSWRDASSPPRDCRGAESGDRQRAHRPRILSGGPSQALGRRVRCGDRSEWLTVVGVVADIRQRGLESGSAAHDLRAVPAGPQRLRAVRVVRRAHGHTRRVAEGIRAEIRRAAPDLPIESTVTMDEAVAASVAQPRFRTLLLALFAAAATLIATCGIYGLMAYAVTQRRREIGVRMALGADRGDVLRLVLTRALRIVAAGVIVGLAGAVAVTRVLQTFLFG
jgi:predicted permease